MTPDDLAALVKLEEQLVASPSGQVLQPSVHVPWLVRLVRQYEARVAELEAGGIPEVIARKDAAIVERDAHAAKMAAQIAKFEAEHLPNPRDYYREIEKLEDVSPAILAATKLVAPEDPIPQSDKSEVPPGDQKKVAHNLST